MKMEATQSHSAGCHCSGAVVADVVPERVEGRIADLKWRLADGRPARWQLIGSNMDVIDTFSRFGLDVKMLDTASSVEAEEDTDEYGTGTEGIRHTTQTFGGTDVTASRLPQVLASKRHTHTLRVRIPSASSDAVHCWHLLVNKRSGQVRWESPLVGCQRAEGFVMHHTAGKSDMRVMRFHPAVVYRAVACLLTAALSADNSVSLNAKTATDRTLYEFRYYKSASDALIQQLERVSAGGEEWTRTEQLAKLERLKAMAALIRDKEPSDTGRYSEFDESVLEALEAGCVALEASRDEEGTRDLSSVPSVPVVQLALARMAQAKPASV